VLTGKGKSKSKEEPKAEKVNQPEPENVHGTDKPHNGKYGNFDHGNYDAKADAKNKEESNKKFDQAVADDKARTQAKNVEKLTALKEELKADGQKHGAKIIDKKIKEMSQYAGDPGEAESNRYNAEENDKENSEERDPSLPRRASDIAKEVDSKMDQAFTEKDWPNSRLASLVSDLLMEEEDGGSVNDLDRSDMLGEISSHVQRGIKNKEYSFEEWLKEVDDTY
jgi:hypothetical protein